MHRLLTILTLLTLLAPPASTFAAQTQAERERERREAQQERAREQRERQQERERDQRERQQERERDRQRGPRETERGTRTLNIGAEGEIDLANISGDVTITRGNANAATIEWIKTAEGPNAREVLSLVTVDIADRGPRAEIRTRYPERDVLRGRNLRNVNVNVAFTITAPQNARLTIKSISGGISVKDIAGALTLESVSGSVTVANAGRTVIAKSISGDVETTDTRIDGSLEAGTVSGAVRLRRTRVQGAKVSSVSGDVVIEDVVSDRVNAQTISGTVTFGGELTPNGRYEFSSHSGSVQVALSGKTGFQVEATSFSGSINTDFPLTLTGKGGRGRSLRATYGNGSAFLDLTAFSGSISITKR